MKRLILLFTWFTVVANAGIVSSAFTDTIVVGGFNSPTAFAQAPDGRIFVAEQGGAIRVVKNGVLLPSSFATVPTAASGERGLLGITVDPNFVSNGYVYAYYTVTPATGASFNRVVRFTATGDTGGSATNLLDLSPLSGATNHNGGALHFGLDGKLYIGVGDNANGANAQSLTNLHGKILRMNADGTIPTDNPFFSTATGVNRLIWALGLRNPYSFAVQPGTGNMLINDVGQNAWEEINAARAGANYGWPGTEGDFNQGSFPGYDRPVYAYAHGSGNLQGFAITGGAFYNPATQTFGAHYLGKYFFADFVRGWIAVIDPLNPSNVQTFLTQANGPVDLLVSNNNGGLYYLERGTGQLHLVQAVNTVPEPGSFGVVATAAAVMALVRRARRAERRGAASGPRE